MYISYVSRQNISKSEKDSVTIFKFGTIAILICFVKGRY